VPAAHQVTSTGNKPHSHNPSAAIPTVNHDNNQHSFNENVRIQNLWDGIELMAALLTM